MKTLTTEHLAMLAVAVSGLIWGLYWIPLRALDSAGITGVWAILLFYGVPALVLAPLMWIRRLHLLRGGWPLHLAGMLAGSALVLYAGALIFTDVVRALLLFYLTPLWSTLLEKVLLNTPITPRRWTTMGLALLGLLLILNVDSGFDSTFGPGDWMGLVSGVIWAFAAVTMKSERSGAGIDIALSYFFWGTLAALALMAAPLDGARSLIDWDTVRAVLPWFGLVVVVLIVPPALAMMWGATILSPGLVAILFMTEITAGALTAAIWANEPFGLREALGVLLITTAGLWEPVMQVWRGET